MVPEVEEEQKKTKKWKTKSVYTMEVHVTKCRNQNFECGLCEQIFVKEKDLDTHLRTSETYECSNCREGFSHDLTFGRDTSNK